MADNDIKMICSKCGKATKGITREIEYTLKEGRYLVCMHCSNKLEYPYGDIKNCMKERCYKRENGVMKQMRNK
ncbi:MAG TPA: hypothetical protein DEF30_08295 [Proteiniclasticum sp.]|uniref:hypothetical protein n=1 Tax=Proteiniclasticum sp. TaxID=2053595 RepID=UPI000E9E8149|nr:hypothetical protein [Proteiniclasticum sp.]HBW13800.1 hypothetical protein [Proteiniclasticum sp.]